MTETYTYDRRDRLTEISAFGEVSTSAAPEVKERYYAALARQPSRYAPRVMLSFAGLLLSAALAPLGWIGCGDRRRRRQVRHSSIALLLCVCMSVDPQQVCAFNNEAIRAHAMMVAGIGALGTTVTTYEYDDNGNQIQKTVGSATTVYVFDAENRLKEFGPESYGTPTAAYTYDADGVRNSKTVSGPTTTDYLTDKNRPYAQVIEEIDTTTPQTPTVLIRYVYGDDLISQTADPEGASPATSYFHYDGQMSTRQLTDDSGSSSAVTDHYKYDAFGKQLIASPGSTANKYLYTGEQYDSDLGQYYLRARYYDYAVGRFISPDKFDGFNTEPLTLHKYIYAVADSINNVDPSGHSFISLLGALAIQGILIGLYTAAIGAAFGAAVGAIDAWLGGGNVIQGAITGAKWGGIIGFSLGFLAPFVSTFLGPAAISFLANMGAGASLLLGALGATESFADGHPSQGLFRLGLGFLGAYWLNKNATRPLRPVNIGGEGEIPGVINLQGRWALSKTYGRATDGKTLAQMVSEGHDFQIFNAKSGTLPYPDNSVPKVFTNSVPIDSAGLWPAIKSSEIRRILQAGGQWIHNGAVAFTKGAS